MKSFKILLAFGLCLSLFTACSKDNVEKTKKANTTENKEKSGQHL